ncbi:NUDIX hydrolase [Novosphingobium sp. ZN18A2]|uniref:NUDIX hydrolase n=1 Tax=Novosphingobium sp. ZN18A2 TaxID=3079861 RepID=UPI0030D18792
MPDTPVVPRPAATVLLIRDDPFEVLMVRRNGRGMFAHLLVFPGGLVEESDACESWLPHCVNAGHLDARQRAHRIAALRETWEEASILLVDGADGPISRPPDNPHPDDFRHAVRQSGGKLDLEALQLFGHWITPEDAPKRYDTLFFIARAPHGQTAQHDGGETVALEWIEPHSALQRDREGVGGVMFPTRLNLLRLTETPGVEQAFAAGPQRRIMTVTPRVEHRESGPVICIPQEAGYSQWEEPVRSSR